MNFIVVALAVGMTLGFVLGLFAERRAKNAMIHTLQGHRLYVAQVAPIHGDPTVRLDLLDMTDRRHRFELDARYAYLLSDALIVKAGAALRQPTDEDDDRRHVAEAANG
jgi:hypothetical protein